MMATLGSDTNASTCWRSDISTVRTAWPVSFRTTSRPSNLRTVRPSSSFSSSASSFATRSISFASSASAAV
jgi:hypothetical protein